MLASIDARPVPSRPAMAVVCGACVAALGTATAAVGVGLEPVVLGPAVQSAFLQAHPALGGALGTIMIVAGTLFPSRVTGRLS